MNIEKALVVDDSKVAHFVLSKLLKERGIQVDWVESGEDAIKYLEQNPPPDIVFMDIMMPGMAGFEAAKAINRNPALSAPPIIMCSGNAGERDQKAADESGAFGFLAKPYTAEELDEVLKRLPGEVVPATPVPRRPATAPEPEVAGIIAQAEEAARRIVAEAVQEMAEQTSRTLSEEIGRTVAQEAQQVAQDTARTVAEESGRAMQEEWRKDCDEQVSRQLQEALRQHVAGEEFKQQIRQAVRDVAPAMVQPVVREAASLAVKEQQPAESSSETVASAALARANMALAVGVIAMILAVAAALIF